MPHSHAPLIPLPLQQGPSATLSSSGGRSNIGEEWPRAIPALGSSPKVISWFHYPIVLRDTLDWLSDDYAIFDLAAAGDTLENMKRGISNIIDVIQRENSQGFLLSGGGNDILEANRLTLLLRPYTPDPSGGPLYKTAQDYIIMHRTRRISHSNHR